MILSKVLLKNSNVKRLKSFLENRANLNNTFGEHALSTTAKRDYHHTPVVFKEDGKKEYKENLKKPTPEITAMAMAKANNSFMTGAINHQKLMEIREKLKLKDSTKSSEIQNEKTPDKVKKTGKNQNQDNSKKNKSSKQRKSSKRKKNPVIK